MRIEMVELYYPNAVFYAELFNRMNTKCLLFKMVIIRYINISDKRCFDLETAGLLLINTEGKLKM